MSPAPVPPPPPRRRLPPDPWAALREKLEDDGGIELERPPRTVEYEAEPHEFARWQRLYANHERCQFDGSTFFVTRLELGRCGDATTMLATLTECVELNRPSPEGLHAQKLRETITATIDSDAVRSPHHPKHATYSLRIHDRETGKTYLATGQTLPESGPVEIEFEEEDAGAWLSPEIDRKLVEDLCALGGDDHEEGRCAEPRTTVADQGAPREAPASPLPSAEPSSSTHEHGGVVQEGHHGSGEWKSPDCYRGGAGSSPAPASPQPWHALREAVRAELSKGNDGESILHRLDLDATDILVERLCVAALREVRAKDSEQSSEQTSPGSHPGWNNPGDAMAVEAMERGAQARDELAGLRAAMPAIERNLADGLKREPARLDRDTCSVPGCTAPRYNGFDEGWATCIQHAPRAARESLEKPERPDPVGDHMWAALANPGEPSRPRPPLRCRLGWHRWGWTSKRRDAYLDRACTLCGRDRR